MDRDRERDRDRYPSGGSYEEERYPLDADRNRYLIGDRMPYPMDRERYPMDRERYPMDRERYPMDRERYPSSDRRYPYDERMPTRDRYPDGGGYVERYPSGDSRYPTRDRYTPYRPIGGHYPSIKDNSLPSDMPHTRPYPPDDEVAFRPYLIGGNRFNEDRYGSRYPSRYPHGREPPASYNGRDVPERESGFPDRRFRPSSYDSRHPLLLDGPHGSGRYGPDSRYPPDDLIHSARRPEPDSAKRYPPAPLVPTTSISKYPSSPNRFPVGTDRFPLDIYKYGNRYEKGGGGGVGGGERIRPGNMTLIQLNKKTN